MADKPLPGLPAAEGWKGAEHFRANAVLMRPIRSGARAVPAFRTLAYIGMHWNAWIIQFAGRGAGRQGSHRRLRPGRAESRPAAEGGGFPPEAGAGAHRAPAGRGGRAQLLYHIFQIQFTSSGSRRKRIMYIFYQLHSWRLHGSRPPAKTGSFSLRRRH